MWTASGDRTGRLNSVGATYGIVAADYALLIPELSTEAPPDVASRATCVELA
jgi:hypothetical protein